ncbi:hypothetical protein [Salinispora pacifica]|uniref:hypothetical protein n=1 Tax=Salinispora pacifica TaxID=351187 RepID=UPI0004811185|nr:hypothetical protein [Salinispora pacifica]
METDTLVVAITGIDDLVALPVGVAIQDRDGDVFTKIDIDTYASAIYTFPANYLLDYLPAIVLCEPIEFEAGDVVRITKDGLDVIYIRSGDLAEVAEVDDAHIWVRFEDFLHLPFKREEVELVRRSIESARKGSDQIVDQIVSVFRGLLDEIPTAAKGRGQPAETAEPVLITSVAELNALPNGSVVTATVATASPTRYKSGGRWRVMGSGGTYDYTTSRLAEAARLRLVYKPAA